MIVRIVKMGFEASKIDTFLKNFEYHKHQIRRFEGCHFLELYQDEHEATQFFTYSYWHSAEALERYRQSDLFKMVWSKTKPLFNKKPEAWSVRKIESLK